MTAIIAELSGNWSGSQEKLKDMICAAARCGCDMVKIQTYKPADMHDPENNHIYEKYSIPEDWFPELFATAKAEDIPLFSSVFAPWAVEFLERFDCPIYKIASPDSTRLPIYTPLIMAILKTGKKFYISSGQQDMGWAKTQEADITFYCKAGYPATINENDLRYMESMCEGFSDHTADVASSLAMIQAGATHIEKHFKLDDDCIDAAFSLNPTQMQLLCRLAHR